MNQNALAFGRSLVAMVSPMTPDGALDFDSAKAVADHLIKGGCDGIVVNGTTGESATLSTDESLALIETIAKYAGDRAKVVAGVGSNDTAHSVDMAVRAAAAGADALLVVSPYYNKPTQRGLVAHCRTIADSTDLPVMLYDIPGRTGIPFSTDTLLALSEHPRILAVKDAKGDLWAASQLMAMTDLAWYCGIDELNLAYLAQGATGLVSVAGHVQPRFNLGLIEAIDNGEMARARAIHEALIPLVDAIMHTSQGAIMAKAALAEMGVIADAHVRMPLVVSEEADLEVVRTALALTPEYDEV